MSQAPAKLIQPFAALLLLVGVAACDRSPRNAAPAPKVEAGAVTTPVPAETVALSGAVRDLPAATTPDAANTLAKPGSPTAAVRPPPPVDASPRTPPPAGESTAMRDFREAQERRDRELLERDMDQARAGGSIRDEPSRALDPRDDSPRDDEALARDDETLDSIPSDGELPLDDELPPDDDLPPSDEPRYEDEPPMDEESSEDDELQWDPATGTWR